jgi:hypothetical protein
MRRARPEVEHATATTMRSRERIASDGALGPGDVLRAEGRPKPTALTFAAEFAARHAALSGFAYRAECFAVRGLEKRHFRHWDSCPRTTMRADRWA